MAGGTGQPGATTGANGSQSTAAPSDTTTNPFFNGANAQSQFNQTPTYTNPYGTGANTLANYFAKLPSYAQPSTTGTGNTAFAANLAAQTATQASAQDKALKAAEALRVQQSADALKAYQIQKANAEWQAKLDAANKQISELRAAQASWDGSPLYSSSWDSPGGATGGLASLQGFDQ